jgi:hypothetical protein
MIKKLTKFKWMEETTKQLFDIHVKKKKFNKNDWNNYKKKWSLNWINKKFTIIC